MHERNYSEVMSLIQHIQQSEDGPVQLSTVSTSNVCLNNGKVLAIKILCAFQSNCEVLAIKIMCVFQSNCEMPAIIISSAFQYNCEVMAINIMCVFQSNCELPAIIISSAFQSNCEVLDIKIMCVFQSNYEGLDINMSFVLLYNMFFAYDIYLMEPRIWHVMCLMYCHIYCALDI